LCGALLQKEPLVSHAAEDMAQKQAGRSAAGGPKRKNALFLIVANKQKHFKRKKTNEYTLMQLWFEMKQHGIDDI